MRFVHAALTSSFGLRRPRSSRRRMIASRRQRAEAVPREQHLLVERHDEIWSRRPSS